MDKPCALCQKSSDPEKAKNSSYHVYESCFDHPTLGQTNRLKFQKILSNKKKFGGKSKK